MVGLAGLAPVVILEQERHTWERRTEVDAVGVGASAFELAMDDRVERRIASLDPFDRGIDQLSRMHVTTPHERGERRGVEVVVVVHTVSAARGRR